MIATLLLGCTAQNTSISTLHFNNDAKPFPDDYRERAALALARRAGPDDRIQLSKPATMVGISVFEPKRWYVCVRGAEVKPPKRKTPPLYDLVEGWVSPSSKRPELVLVFGTASPPTILDSTGSRLCDDVEFEDTTLTEMAATERPALL